MKKVGFIDYYLDEWHANTYPELIKRLSEGRYEVMYAWAEIDSPLEAGKTSKEWEQNYGIRVCSTIQEVIEKSDVLVVLSPDNPERHEELCKLPLQSGKPTFVDKTFAPSGEIAQKIFALAKEFNTPCYTTSALRYAREYQELCTEGISGIVSFGPGEPSNYAIHQIEPIVDLMGTEAKRVMSIGNESLNTLVIEFNDHRMALSTHLNSKPFEMSIKYENKEEKQVVINSNFFEEAIKKLIEFFDTGKSSVCSEQTITIMKILEVAQQARKSPGVWMNIK